MTETIQLPFKLTNGNDGRGNKWFSSAKLRKDFENALRARGMARGETYPFPVKVIVTRVLSAGERLWDTSSVGRGNWKEIEDALVACGWFVDDSPRYITQTDFRQDASRRKSEVTLEVTIEQDGDRFSGSKDRTKEMAL